MRPLVDDVAAEDHAIGAHAHDDIVGGERTNPALIGGAGLLSRALEGAYDHGVQLGVQLLVELPDAADIEVGEIHRRDLARAKVGHELGRWRRDSWGRDQSS